MITFFRCFLSHSSQAFDSVTMLYIPCVVNKQNIVAFVDTGAQMTIMSDTCAERLKFVSLPVYFCYSHRSLPYHLFSASLASSIVAGTASQRESELARSLGVCMHLTSRSDHTLTPPLMNLFHSLISRLAILSFQPLSL